MKMRTGFTLIEVMITSTIMVIAMTAVATLFMGIHRLVSHSYCVARASLDLRAEREHLLFHTYHEGGNSYWAGALSAWHKVNVTQGSEANDIAGSLRFDVMGLETWALRTRFGERTAEYPPSSSEKFVRAIVDGNTYKLNNSTGVTLKGSNLPILIPVKLVCKSGFGNTVETYAQRVVIPVFGAAQVWNNENVFHDTAGVNE